MRVLNFDPAGERLAEEAGIQRHHRPKEDAPLIPALQWVRDQLGQFRDKARVLHHT